MNHLYSSAFNAFPFLKLQLYRKLTFWYTKSNFQHLPHPTCLRGPQIMYLFDVTEPWAGSYYLQLLQTETSITVRAFNITGSLSMTKGVERAQTFDTTVLTTTAPALPPAFAIFTPAIFALQCYAGWTVVRFTKSFQILLKTTLCFLHGPLTLQLHPASQLSSPRSRIFGLFPLQGTSCVARKPIKEIIIVALGCRTRLRSKSTVWPVGVPFLAPIIGSIGGIR